MKNRDIIERRRDRAEFVYLWRREIKLIIDNGMSRIDRQEFVDNIARHHLVYSKGTNSLDIFYAIRKTFDQLQKLNDGIY